MRDMVTTPNNNPVAKVDSLDPNNAALGPGYKYYLQGAIIKYIWRYEHKGNPAEDLAKAQFYLTRLQYEIGETNE